MGHLPQTTAGKVIFSGITFPCVILLMPWRWLGISSPCISSNGSISMFFPHISNWDFPWWYPLWLPPKFHRWHPSFSHMCASLFHCISVFLSVFNTSGECFTAPFSRWDAICTLIYLPLPFVETYFSMTDFKHNSKSLFRVFNIIFIFFSFGLVYDSSHVLLFSSFMIYIENKVKPHKSIQRGIFIASWKACAI